jgi:hypothetical protein
MSKRIAFQNFLDTITSFIRNDATAPRIWQLQDRDGTLADNTDIAGRVATTRKVNDQPLSADIQVPTALNNLRAGLYHTLLGNVPTANTVNLAANTLRAYYVKISSTITITEINSEVTTNVASTKYRMGIYTDNGSHYPDQLVAGSDAGEYDSATTGNKPSATVSITLTPGIYWIAHNTNGAPTLRGCTFGWLNNLGFPNTAFATQSVNRVSVALTYGALPSTFTGGGTYASAAIPLTFFKL